ncbi:hypothetical protein QOT17_011832 [Balamuthia mandrillaris]
MGFSFWGGSAVRFCDFDEEAKECEWTMWAVAVGVLWIPGLLFGLLTVVFGTVYFCCCRCRCGGKPLFWRVALIALSVCILVFIVVIISIDADVQRANDEFADTSINYASDFVKEVEGTIQRTLDAPYTPEAAAQASWAVDGLAAAEQAEEEITRLKDPINYGAMSKFVVEVVFLVMLGIACVVVIIGLLCGCNKFVFCYGIALMILSIPVWLLFSWGLFGERIFTDACDECEEERATPTNSAMSYLIECDDPLWADWVASVTAFREGAITAGCAAYTSLCASGQATCPPGQCTEETLYDIPNLEVDDNGQNRTVEQCSTQCTDQDLQDFSVNLMETYDAILEYDAIYEIVLQWLNCGFVLEYCDEVDPTLCGDMKVAGLSGFFAMLLGILVLISVVMAGLVTRVLNPDDDEEEMELSSESGSESDD